MEQFDGESGLELDLPVVKGRPVMYNLDPDHNHRAGNMHYPVPRKPPQVVSWSNDKLVVSLLCGLGAGFAAMIPCSSALAIGAVAGMAALLAWECVEIQ